MASLKNASKANARVHRERSQPASRAHLGSLEKRKDYRARAEEHHKKASTIKALKRKALDRNPDEFYFNMVHTQKVDGIHSKKEEEGEEPQYTETQIKLMHSQDQKYVNMKRTAELRKIERLKSSLHLLDSESKPQNKHIIFVDSKKDVQKFDAAKHFDTHPALMHRAYNRPTREMLEKGPTAIVDEDDLVQIAAERGKKYNELTKRIAREKELHVVSQKMEMKKNLMNTKAKRKKIQEESKSAPAQYRWVFQRKR